MEREEWLTVQTRRAQRKCVHAQLPDELMHARRSHTCAYARRRRPQRKMALLREDPSLNRSSRVGSTGEVRATMAPARARCTIGARCKGNQKDLRPAMVET